MKFGIELELFSPLNHSQLRTLLTENGVEVNGTEWYSSSEPHGKWVVKTDGSLHDGPCAHGAEIVSPILDTEKPKDFLTIQKICKLLQSVGCRVDHHCGFHVHVDAATLNLEAKKRTFVRYTKFEAVIDRCMPVNRRNDVYYAKSGTSYLSVVLSADTDTALPRSVCDRYMRVNLSALQKYGTIEFRQHSGTINSETVIRWVRFLTQFVEASKSEPTSENMEQTTARRRRRVTRATPRIMSRGCEKVLNAMRVAQSNELTISALQTATGLAASTVKSCISTLKITHGMTINPLANQRGVQDKCYRLRNPNDQPRPAVTAVPAPVDANGMVIADTLWRGINPEIKAFYHERAMELGGFDRTVQVDRVRC